MKTINHVFDTGNNSYNVYYTDGTSEHNIRRGVGFDNVIDNVELHLAQGGVLRTSEEFEGVFYPATEEPVVEPTTEEPVVEPTTEEPVVEPTTEEPVVEPTTDPTPEEPVV